MSIKRISIAVVGHVSEEEHSELVRSLSDLRGLQIPNHLMWMYWTPSKCAQHIASEGIELQDIDWEKTLPNRSLGDLFIKRS